MTERKPGGEPKIGPYSMQVPPPSPNGSRVEHGSSSLDPLRRVLPGLIVAVVLALTALPRIGLLETAHLAQWWRVLIAAVAGGVTTGAMQRRSAPIAAVLGTTVTTIALFIAYGLVRNDEEQAASATTIAADLGRLLAWAVVAGGGSSAIAFAVRRTLERRAGARTVKATFPRPN